jgi:WD40 repeat protein
LKGHNGVVRCTDFSHHLTEEDALLVTCSDDKSLKLWSLHQKSFQRCFLGHNNWVRTCKFSPDSKYIISGSDDGTVKLWDVNNGDNVVTYKLSSTSSSVREVQFDKSGNLISASNPNGNVTIYDLRSDEVVHSMPQQSSAERVNNISSVRFFHGGTHLLSISNGGNFNLWDMRNWRFTTLHHQLEPTIMRRNSKDEEFSFCCDISVDGARIATSWPDKRVLVWKRNFELPKTPHTIALIHDCHNQRQSQVKYKEPIEATQAHKHARNVEERENSYQKATKISQQPIDREKKIASQSMPLEGIIDHIVCQLDTITSTMIKLEKRLAIQEDNISALQTQINREKKVPR